jgi:hypothetical protein
VGNLPAQLAGILASQFFFGDRFETGARNCSFFADEV